jgi:Virulence factor
MTAPAEPTLTVIYWRDIPAQVTATDGGRTGRVQLADRFQEAIDEAAMEAGLAASDDYLNEWRRDTRPCESDLEREMAAEAERLEAFHTPEVLRALVRSGGVTSPGDPHPPA